MFDAGDWAGIESFIFDGQYLSKSWVLYIAVEAMTGQAQGDSIAPLERILQRAFDELDDCPALVEQSICLAETFCQAKGDTEAERRFVNMRRSLLGRMQREGHLDAP